MHIRLLAETDSIADLTRMLHAAYARLGAMGFNYTAVDQTEEVTRERVAAGECLVVEDGGEIVGTAIFYRRPAYGSPYFDKPHVATLGQFAVRPEQQGKGIGNLLLRELERRAIASGATHLALDTSEGAHHLVNWYEREGFRFVEHVQWPGKTYRSVIMSKPLI